MNNIKEVLSQIYDKKAYNTESLAGLLNIPFEDSGEILTFADSIMREHCGKGILLRGIVEFSSYCKNNCYYCGLNIGNKNLERYRLNADEIFLSAKKIYDNNIKTIVLQSGEDDNFDWDIITYVIKKIKKDLDISITLSCGELEKKIYEKWKTAGADRYLLKIETSNKELYEKLHPKMSFDSRIDCLDTLEDLGYQTGSGIIVGLKGQTLENIANDILFFADKDFDMIGINPFIAHSESMLKDHPNGDPHLTVKTIALTRIITKNAHLPATTALGSIGNSDLRVMALKAGANVIMPNFTPYEYRKNYEIYPNKRCLSEDENIMQYLKEMAEESGRTLDFSRGDTLKKK